MKKVICSAFLTIILMAVNVKLSADVEFVIQPTVIDIHIGEPVEYVLKVRNRGEMPVEGVFEPTENGLAGLSVLVKSPAKIEPYWFAHDETSGDTMYHSRILAPGETVESKLIVLYDMVANHFVFNKAGVYKLEFRLRWDWSRVDSERIVAHSTVIVSDWDVENNKMEIEAFNLWNSREIAYLYQLRSGAFSEQAVFAVNKLSTDYSSTVYGLHAREILKLILRQKQNTATNQSDAERRAVELARQAAVFDAAASMQAEEDRKRLEAAEAGDIDAIMHMAMSSAAEGDFAGGEKWALRMAASGSRGEARIGVFYIMFNDGDRKLEAKGVEWLNRAAGKGEVLAQRSLGMHLIFGGGGERDAKKGVEWLRKAAGQGDTDSMLVLARCHDEGIGVAKDETKAAEWIIRAAELDNSHAWTLLAERYANGLGVVKDDAKAAEWLRKAAETGDLSAMLNLGRRFAEGRGVDKNEAEAFAWISKAAAEFEYEAMMELAKLHDEGIGVAKNPEKAIELLLEAAENDYALAQIALGKRYIEGVGVAKDPVRGFEWIRTAANLGYPFAVLELARCYREGIGVPKDEAKAAELTRMAQEAGDGGDVDEN